MRPIHLSLTAFGPFAGTEEVDFGPLAQYGVFVVGGPTGAGKSTLFDAMTFALYGTIPGERLDHVHSHHADRWIAPAAALTFEVSGVRYRVERVGRHERPKVRGRGVTVSAPTAVLFRIDPGGETPVAHRPHEVTTRCEQLVGLSAQQFQRVVLLPQGKWAEFLLADTKSRRDLLQQLFGTQLYERVTDLAKERAGALRVEVGDADATIERHRTNAVDHVGELVRLLGDDAADALAASAASHESGGRLDIGATPSSISDYGTDDIDRLGRLLDALTAPISGASERSHSLRSAAADAERTHQRAAHVAADWNRRERARAELVRIDAERSHMTAEASRRDAAERAAPVAAAHRALTDASDRVSTAAAAVAEAFSTLVARAERAGVPDPSPFTVESSPGSTERIAAIDRQLSTRRADLERRRGLAEQLAALEASLTVAERAEKATADDVAATERRLGTLNDRRGPVLEELARHTEDARDVDAALAALDAAAAVVRLRDEHDEHVAQTDVVNRAHDDALATLQTFTTAFLADVAPELASRLTPGDPCPVCGSCEHPHPAAAAAGVSVTRDDLEAARNRQQAAASALHAALAEVKVTRDRLGDHLTTPRADLEAVRTTARARHEAAVAAERAMHRVAIELERIDKQLAESTDDLPRLAAAAAAAQTLAAERREQVRAVRSQVGDDDGAALGNTLDLLARAERALDVCRSRSSELASAAGARDEAERALDQCVSTSEFATAADALAAALPVAELRELARRVDAWTMAARAAEAQVATFGELDLPDELPPVEPLEHAARTARATADRAAQHCQQIELRAADARRSLAAAATADAESTAVRAAYGVARSVFETCNGNNAPRVELEAWVLAGELDRVTSAANVHLARMTRSRYSLRRDDPTGAGARRSGLDLVVDDADTGRPRPPSTLSGGEQFQASLALALGLADVVSQGGHGASGIVHEALFIDEGFGSLDADALDEAVDTLIDLQSSGRLVGVITHVDAMKRQLPLGIEVRRLPAGGSRVVQP